MGLEVLPPVASAEEAVDVVARTAPDLVLMDIHLKGRMDGIEAAGAIRQRHDVPVIYLTAHSDAATLTRAKVTEPFGYLLKPFDERDLRVAIELALHKHEMDKRLRESEEQLHQARKLEAVGRLAGGVAHDVNNMMTVVLGYAELLLREVGDSDPRRQVLLEMRRAANRSADIARQLLAVGRRQVLHPVVVDVNRLIGDSRPMVTEVLGQGIELRCELDPEGAMVRIDPGQFDRVLINLGLNASEAMPDGGRLTIASRMVTLGKDDMPEAPEVAAGDYVLLSVADTGRGMDADTTSCVFEPFFTTKPPGAGAGLGLATVYGIVKQSGGHLFVDSALGQGTTFRIYLPRVKPDVEAGPSHVSATERGRETILLVEDDHAVRSMIQQVLRHQGYTVLEAVDGAEAMLLCEDAGQRIDLLLTDSIMPGMSGRELAERLIAVRPALSVLVMSGYSEDRVLEQGLPANAAFIQKPFAGSELVSRVRTVLDK